MGKLITSSEYALLCANKDFCSKPFRPIPDILELIEGKYSLIRFLLKPIASKLHPPLYELTTEIPILLIILSNPLFTD